MDSEDFLSMNSGIESLTDSPPEKVPRAENTSASLGDHDDCNVGHGYFDNDWEAYSTSTSPTVVAVNSPESDVTLERSAQELDEIDAIVSNQVDQGSSGNGRCQSNMPGDTQESQPSELHATYTEAGFEIRISEAQTKVWEDNIFKCFQQSNVNLQDQHDNSLQRNEYVSSSEDINSMLREIEEMIRKDQTKTKEMIAGEYLSCPTKFKRVKDFISYFRKDIHSHLESSGENQRNSVGSGYLKSLMKKPGCSEMLQLLADVVKNMENKLEPVDHGLNNDASVPDAPLEPSQNQAGFNNVQVPEIVNKASEEYLDANETMDITIADDDNDKPSSSSSIPPPNVAKMDTSLNWQQMINDKLLQKLQIDSNRPNSSTKQKINKMGKRLFITLFSENEIVGGFARARKNQPGYDEEKVNEISQLINFMLSPNNDYSVDKFRSGKRENKGLKGQNWITFWDRVIVHFGSDERKRINRKRSLEI